MATYSQQDMYDTSSDYNIYWDYGPSASATTYSDSSTAHRFTADRFKLYLDVLSDNMVYDNHADVSKEKIQELIVEALGMEKRQKHAPIIEFTDEEFEL